MVETRGFEPLTLCVHVLRELTDPKVRSRIRAAEDHSHCPRVLTTDSRTN